MVLRLFYIYFLTSSICLSASAQIIFKNPSFEGTPMYGQVPPSWETDLFQCGGFSTPDTQPGFWDTYLAPHNGNSYIGMVARYDQTSEGVFQHLVTPLQKGRCYSFLIYLAKTPSYDIFANPLILEIWGGNDRCERLELFWSSSAISDPNWVPYKVDFSPKSDYAYLVFLATGYGGNILLDDITEEKISTYPELSLQEVVCEDQTLKLDAFSPDFNSYLWNTGETSPSIEVHNTGIYSVTMISPACTITLSKEVFVKKKPDVKIENDTILYFGTDFFKVTSTLIPSDASVLWSTDEVTSNITIYNSGTYWVSATNECGTSSDTIRVEFSPIFIPNVVTMNQDGLNDLFYISGIEPGEWELIILNRWGENVYQNTEYSNTWPSKDISTGVYYYLLRKKDTKYEFRGALHIITN